LNAGTASQTTTKQLNVEDQSDTQDDWNKYIEYNRKFDGMFIWVSHVISLISL